MRYPARSTAGMSWRVFGFISFCYLLRYSIVNELCREFLGNVFRTDNEISPISLQTGLFLFRYLEFPRLIIHYNIAFVYKTSDIFLYQIFY